MHIIKIVIVRKKNYIISSKKISKEFRTFIIIFREIDLFYDEQLDPVMRKIEIARLIAPKIAYQWFENVLSPSWWSHFWLYDGLATLFGEEAVVKVSTLY